MANILLSSIGTRGDVQPILALAVELMALGHAPTVCSPPDFRSWIESVGVPFVPIGPPLKGFSLRAQGGKKFKFTTAQRKQMVLGSVRDQFRVIGEAAQEADLIVAGGALQAASRSIAELRKIPYVYASYCACTLPSWDHAPAPIRPRANRSQSLPRFVNGILWHFNERRWNALFRDPINEARKAIGFSPIDTMTNYVFTDRPWLAADAALGPAGSTSAMRVFQTGAWLLRDSTPLSIELENFLGAGEPPIYFGFGSTVGPGVAVQTLLDVARKLKRRAIVAQGWANLELPNASSDCLSIGETSHEKLFPRVAAIVHHGGAGTTTAAALAGTPQLIVAQNYDQYYWGHRVEKLGIGNSIEEVTESIASDLESGLRNCLNERTAANAHTMANRMECNGASIAAQRLIKDYL